MKYTVSPKFPTFFITPCLTAVVPRTVRAVILSTYYTPFAGGLQMILSTPFSSVEQHGTYLISVLRVAERPLPLLSTFYPLSFLSNLRRVRKLCD